MPTFPVRLAYVHHENTVAQPIIEAASLRFCLARARYTPKNISYETIVRFQDGLWSVETKAIAVGYRVNDDYPMARGYEIGLAVMNWWVENYFLPPLAPVEQNVATARAVWLTRAAHKLLTEVGDSAEQVAALQILASNYELSLSQRGAAPTLKGANWATAAHRHLERDIPEAERQRAVALLAELVTGERDTGRRSEAAVVAA